MHQLDGEAFFFACTHHVHPSEGDDWTFVGSGDTAEDAQRDLESLLIAAGVEAPIQLNECSDERRRRRLIWSAKARAAMFGGVALVEVEE